MKCPECEKNHKYSSGMVCTCGYRFVFSPKDSRLRHMRDNRLAKSIRRVSRDGTAFFTKNQLYSAYLDNAKQGKLLVVVVGIIFIVIGLIALSESLFGLLLILFGLFAIGSAFFSDDVTPRTQFDNGLDMWINNGRKVEGLLTEPTLHTPPEEWPEDDIYDYGVERILIVQRPILVDLLVKNNQHAEQRMLVISESGYPEYLQQRANQLLAERSDLQVFILHDATSEGAQMLERIQNSDWLVTAGNSIVDLGFFESDFQDLNRTEKYRKGTHSSQLPADALRLGSLTLGLGQCFGNQTTFAQELHREAKNEMDAGSSFG